MKQLHSIQHTARAARGGFSLVEMAIGVVVLFVLAAGLTQSLSALRGGAVSGSVESRLQAMGERIMTAVQTDLKRSGLRDLGGGANLPYLFDEGNAQGAFALHAHPPAQHSAHIGETDYGRTREIVFSLPLDVDDRDPATLVPTPDGIPDIDGDGGLVWDPIQYSFVVVTRPDGINYLERRANGGNGRVVGHHVERLTFDTSTTDPVNIPVGACRVRVWLRERDEGGTLHRYFLESVVKLRNGGGL